MAKIIMPLLSGGASGKLGDIVFFQRYGQAIARQRVVPANPNTIKQQVVRHNLSALAQAWKGSGSGVLQDDATGTATGTPNAYYVKLRKFNPTTTTYSEVNFIVLSSTEKTAWENYAMMQKKVKQWSRLYFIGENIKLLMANQNPKRTP